MQVNNFSNVNFTSPSIDKSFYNTAAYLKHNVHTQKAFQEAYTKLSEASKGKCVTIFGDELAGSARVAEMDLFGNIEKFITNDGNPIDAMNNAIRKLIKENTHNKPIKERFKGKGKLNTLV